MQHVHVWRRNWMGGIAVTALLALAAPADALDGRFYVGLKTDASVLRASYDKAVDNTDPRNISPQRGRVNRDDDSADEVLYGLGLLGGYRWNLTPDGLYLSAELDMAYHGGTLRSRLAGRGTSPGRNQYGESWPDRWSVEKVKSQGITLKLGGSPGLLRSWAGSDASIYALAGVRRIKTQIRAHLTGCFVPTPCQPSELGSGTETSNEYFTAWTSGLGLEKMLGAHVALRGEVRYTGYLSEDWTKSYFDGKVTVPVKTDAEEIDFSLGLIWYF